MKNLGVNKYQLSRGWRKLRSNKFQEAKRSKIFANEELLDLLNMQIKLGERNRCQYVGESL
jgi:hypothetical protein